MTSIKEIALEHDDVELYKLACELEKLPSTDPINDEKE